MTSTPSPTHSNVGLRTLLWVAPEILLGLLIFIAMALIRLLNGVEQTSFILLIIPILNMIISGGYCIAVVLLGVKDSRLAYAAKGKKGASALHVLLFCLVHAIIICFSAFGLCLYGYNHW